MKVTIDAAPPAARPARKKAGLDDPNPDLYIGNCVPLNPDVYGAATAPPVLATGAHSKLTSPATQLTPIPGDPDPPDVD